MIPALPITLTVSERGASVENRNGMSAMNRFSGRAQRLLETFGPGTHIIDNAEDLTEDITEGLR